MNEHRKKHLEEEKKKREQELDSISINMGFCNPASTEYIHLDREHKLLCSELDEIESELSLYTQSSLTKNQRVNRFEKKLQKIDFTRARDIVKQIFEKFARQGVSACFLIENTKETKGKLLVDDIRDTLTKEIDDWRHYPINLIANNIVDEQSLLSAIAKFLPELDADTQTFDEPQQYAINIIEKITNSLQVGSIVFLELSDWDALGANQDLLLSWFMEYFWIPLAKKHAQLSQKYANIRIILFMTTYSCLSEKCQNSPHFSSYSKFNKQKVFKLPLPRKWQQQDIRRWIEDTYKYSRQQSLIESKTILRFSQGNPEKTCYILQQRFNSIA
ncbi:MAG: hypothetical protein F6K31_33960 [Symploca sp. SIO2G7]|nr:hypothetical protein [Symploca sp. SIO2G7]